MSGVDLLDTLKALPNYIWDFTDTIQEKESLDPEFTLSKFATDFVHGAWDLANISEAEYLKILRTINASEKSDGTPSSFILLYLR